MSLVNRVLYGKKRPVDPNLLLEARGWGKSFVSLYEHFIHIENSSGKWTIPISALLRVYLTAPKTHEMTIAGSSFAPLDSIQFIVEWVNEVPKSVALAVLKPQRQQFGLMVSAIEQKMNALKTVNTEPIATNATNSVYDELAKLATLRDQGVVTEEEFQEQKKKLLGTKTAKQSQQRFDPQTGRRL